MKTITIHGNVGKDAQVRQVGSSSVMSFSVGVSDGFGDKKRTIWYDVTVWGDRAEKLARHITKGKKVVVVGEHSDREHNGKTYHTVKAYDIEFGGDRQQSGGYDQSPGKPIEGYDYAPGATPGFDEEIPF